MTLDEKLSQIAQERAAKTAHEQQVKQDEALKPVQARIKEIEAVRLRLDIIKGSLEIKSDAPDKSQKGKGMKEHAVETASSIAEQSGHLDSLVRRHSDTLKTLGVESQEQLMSHPEFGEEAEVLAYKKAVAQGEGLKEAEGALKQRLASLGVSVDAGSLSYEAVEKAVGKKLQEVEVELRKEKLKTPEGRAEVIAELAKTFERDTSNMTVRGNLPTRLAFDELVFDRTSNPQSRLDFTYEGRTRFVDWSSAPLLPDNSANVGEKYGWDVLQEAVTKAYAARLGAIFAANNEKAGRGSGLGNDGKQLKAEQDKIKGVLELLKLAISAQVIRAQVSEIQTSDGKQFARDINEAKERIARLNTEGEEARKKIADLARREGALAQGQQVVKTRDNMVLSVPSIEREVEQMEAELGKEKPILVNISGQIWTHKNKEPRIFGKKEWQTQLDALRRLETASKDKIADLEKKLPILRDRRQIRLAKDIYSISHYGVDRLIADQELSGTKEEVFGQLRVVLNETANRKPPESIVKLLADYEALAAKLA